MSSELLLGEVHADGGITGGTDTPTCNVVVGLCTVDLTHLCFGFRYVGAQGLVAILSEIILIIYLIVLTVLAIRSMIKTRGKYVLRV